MFRRNRSFAHLATLLAAILCVMGTALAGRPDGADGEGRDPSRYDPRYDRDAYRVYGDRRDPAYGERRMDDYRYIGPPPIDFRFDERMRGEVFGYYGENFRRGRCPPGLARKHDGCMPPGQARLWRRGQPLPPGVVYYHLPSVLLGRLPPPPPGHRYVRVATDILLIAVGSALVVDAIEDIGR